MMGHRSMTGKIKRSSEFYSRDVAIPNSLSVPIGPTRRQMHTRMIVRYENACGIKFAYSFSYGCIGNSGVTMCEPY